MCTLPEPFLTRGLLFLTLLFGGFEFLVALGFFLSSDLRVVVIVHFALGVGGNFGVGVDGVGVDLGVGVVVGLGVFLDLLFTYAVVGVGVIVGGLLGIGLVIGLDGGFLDWGLLLAGVVLGGVDRDFFGGLRV